MFGLTKREQRWKAEQKAAETIAGVLVAAINAKSHKGEEINKSEQLIACLEGEIAKRDEELAACRVAVENCELFRARIAELEARIVWLECEAQVNAAPVSEAKAQGVVMQSTDGGRNPRYEGLFDGETEEQRASRLNATPVQQVSVPDERIIPTSAELIQWAWEEEPEETRFQEGYNAAKRWVKMQIEAGIAAPAAPAADAGIVDMYRHLQKVTPYRFKKIQDASITDGGDVMYFHKDRFDAALLADMAALAAGKDAAP